MNKEKCLIVDSVNHTFEEGWVERETLKYNDTESNVTFNTSKGVVDAYNVIRPKHQQELSVLLSRINYFKSKYPEFPAKMGVADEKEHTRLVYRLVALPKEK